MYLGIYVYVLYNSEIVASKNQVKRFSMNNKILLIELFPSNK